VEENNQRRNPENEERRKRSPIGWRGRRKNGRNAKLARTSYPFNCGHKFQVFWPHSSLQSLHILTSLPKESFCKVVKNAHPCWGEPP
jgi:hypothetical protein